MNVALNLIGAGLLPPGWDYKDYIGTPIPQGAGPEIGAYEGISASAFISGAKLSGLRILP
jgi:hypothetical protein